MCLKLICPIDDEFMREYYGDEAGVSYKLFSEFIRDCNFSTLSDGNYSATIYFDGTTLFVVHEKRIIKEPSVILHAMFWAKFLARYNPKFIAYMRKGKLKITDTKKIREV